MQMLDRALVGDVYIAHGSIGSDNCISLCAAQSACKAVDWKLHGAGGVSMCYMLAGHLRSGVLGPGEISAIKDGAHVD
jgi:hypothetical protein